MIRKVHLIIQTILKLLLVTFFVKKKKIYIYIAYEIIPGTCFQLCDWGMSEVGGRHNSVAEHWQLKPRDPGFDSQQLLYLVSPQFLYFQHETRSLSVRLFRFGKNRERMVWYMFYYMNDVYVCRGVGWWGSRMCHCSDQKNTHRLKTEWWEGLLNDEWRCSEVVTIDVIWPPSPLPHPPLCINGIHI